MSAECLSPSVMGTASSLTCAPEMPLYLGDPCPCKAVPLWVPLV